MDMALRVNEPQLCVICFSTEPNNLADNLNGSLIVTSGEEHGYRLSSYKIRPGVNKGRSIAQGEDKIAAIVCIAIVIIEHKAGHLAVHLSSVEMPGM